MNPIDEIRDRLARYPKARWETGPDSVTVFPVDDSGFAVSFLIADGEYIVSFSGWHEHFTDAHQAMNCFVFGLSEDCRLKVYTRGSVEYRWTVETQSSGSWVEDSTTAVLLFPFWRRLRVEYRQNRVLPSVAQDPIAAGEGGPAQGEGM